MWAVGFSNGANIATHLLLQRPEAIAGGVLLRPMLTHEPDTLPDLSGRRVLIAYGETDLIAGPDHARRLAATLRRAGADVQLHVSSAGHGLDEGDLEAAEKWWTEAAR